MLAVTMMTCGLTAKIKHQEALKAERDKERMRANLLRAVSHDLRTPLTTIYGSSSALLEKYDDFSDEQCREMLEGISEESQWLYRMVENLLSITKLDGDHVKIIKTETVLDELVDSALVKFSKRYPNQVIDVDIPEAKHKDIFGGAFTTYADISDSKKNKAGIGLSVCDSIIKALVEKF